MDLVLFVVFSSHPPLHGNSRNYSYNCKSQEHRVIFDKPWRATIDLRCQHRKSLTGKLGEPIQRGVLGVPTGVYANPRQDENNAGVRASDDQAGAKAFDSDRSDGEQDDVARGSRTETKKQKDGLLF